MSAGGGGSGAGRALRWVTSQPHAAELLSVAAVAEAVYRSPPGQTAWPTVVAALLAFATTAPAAVFRPNVAAVWVSLAVVLSLASLQTVTIAGLISQVRVLYRAGRYGHPLLATGLAIPFVVWALVVADRVGAGPLPVLLASAAPLAAVSGIALRARSDAVVHHTARQVIAESLVEHTARGERARIARELHDVVAHHISMVVVQAESARLTTPGMPAAGAQRLVDIRDTARAGLTEMRRLLGVLREDADTAAPDLRPQPGLEQLNDLLDEARSASGAPVRLIVSGAAVTLDPGVELAAYRIIQEALTNARRHAPGVAVDVELVYADDLLRVRIRDNGPGLPSGAAATVESGGHGLAGMRERAAAVGGRLRIGPPTMGGFMLEATLPAKAEVVR